MRVVALDPDEAQKGGQSRRQQRPGIGWECGQIGEGGGTGRHVGVGPQTDAEAGQRQRQEQRAGHVKAAGQRLPGCARQAGNEHESQQPHRHVEPEQQPPVDELDHYAAVQVADDPASHVNRADQAQRLGAALRREQIADEGHADRYQRAAAESLDHAPDDEREQGDPGRVGALPQAAGQPIEQIGGQAVGDGDPDRSGGEDRQADQVGSAPPDQIGDAAHEGHRDGVGQQVAADQPGGVVQAAVQRDLQLDDDLRQDGGDDGQVERADEDRQADQGQHQPGRGRPGQARGRATNGAW